MGDHPLDISTMTFGRLHPIEIVPCPKRFASITYLQAAWWRCRCDCGAEKIVCQRALRGGGTQSCGCLRRENALKFERGEKGYYLPLD